MSDSDQEGFRQPRPQVVMQTTAPSLTKTSLCYKPKLCILSRPALCLHSQLSLFQYPLAIDSATSCLSVLPNSSDEKPLDLVSRKDDEEPVLLSQFFPKKLGCVYSRFREGLACKRDLTILIRSIQNRIRHEQFTRFPPDLQPLITTRITFRAQFEGSNLQLVFRDRRGGPFYLLLQNDVNTHGFNHWFHFAITTPYETRIQMVIVNLSREVRFGGQGGIWAWNERLSQRIGYKCVESRFGHCDSPKRYWSLFFQYDFKPNEETYFSLALPYSYSKTLRFLKDQLKTGLSHANVHVDQAGKSQLGNPIPCLFITSKTKPAKRTVLITARQHPSETVGSFVCEAIIRILLVGDSLSLSLLQDFSFIILPILNPDGVIHGNSRTNLTGVDLNRSWDPLGIFQATECQQIWQFLQNQSKKGVTINWAIDLHGHSRQLGFFAYFGVKNERSQLLTHYLQESVYFQKNKCFHGVSYNKRSSIRGQLNIRMKIANSLTIETSMFGFRDQLGQLKHYEEKHFRQIGSSILQGLLKTEQTMTDSEKKVELLVQIDKQQKEQEPDEEQLDSDSSPQEDYIKKEQLQVEEPQIVEKKQIFKRKVRTEQEQPNKANQSVSPFPRQMTPSKDNSSKQLGRPKRNEKAQLFNLTFYASRSRNSTPKPQSQLRQRRRIYSQMRSERKQCQDGLQSQQQLKRSIEMRKCIRLAFQGKVRGRAEGSQIQIVLYPTLSGVGADLRKSLRDRKDRVKDLRIQEYGNLLRKTNQTCQMRTIKKD